jgi:hypothetical protein
MFQSTNVEDTITFTMYDYYDVGSVSVISSMLDDDSTPYDFDDEEDVIVP